MRIQHLRDEVNALQPIELSWHRKEALHDVLTSAAEAANGLEPEKKIQRMSEALLDQAILLVEDRVHLGVLLKEFTLQHNRKCPFFKNDYLGKLCWIYPLIWPITVTTCIIVISGNAPDIIRAFFTYWK